jgi:uncharacterized protein (TIGR03083 family)
MEYGRIEVVSLFPELNSRLMELVSGMSPADWEAGTRFPNWKVKDIVAHLLDTSVRRLSSQRDGYSPRATVAIESMADLVSYITGMADRWAAAFSGVSPRILTQLVGRYQDELADFLATLDPDAEALFPVAWAGESSSANWFDIAREYTERWHHQMQIRDSLGAEPIYSRRLYHPVLDAFMRALPHHFREVARDEGFLLGVEVPGEAGGRWLLEWRKGGPTLAREAGREPDTLVTIGEDVAWRIFTKWGGSGSEKDLSIVGDPELGRRLLDMTCIMIS